MNNVSHYRMEKTEREHRKSRVRTKGKEPREIEAPFVSALGKRDYLAVKVRYRLGSRNC